MQIYKYRILEETSVFADGSERVEFTLQSQCGTNPAEWKTLGSSRTLVAGLAEWASWSRYRQRFAPR